MRPREARVPELFVRATVCTRDNTHASTQKIQLYVWRYVIPGSTWVLDVLRLSVDSERASFAMSLLRDGP